MCKMPPPAVIHCVSPFVMRPPPPVESLCSNTPSIMYVTVSKPRCGCHAVPSRLTRPVVDLAHLVHVDERIEVGEVHAGERTANGKPFAFEPRQAQS